MSGLALSGLPQAPVMEASLRLLNVRSTVMERNSKSGPRRRSSKKMTAPIMSEFELARLGDGVIAYIRTMSSEEAQERFPSIDNLPRGLTLYALHAADGTPLMLTDSRQAALGHAMSDELEVASVH
jgi:hypothetical protein